MMQLEQMELWRYHNMKIFDGHSDIFTDITVRSLKGEKNIIKKYHMDRLKKGNVGTMILGIWIEPLYFGKDCTWRMLEIMGAISEELEHINDYAGIVYNYDDLKKINKVNKLGIVMGMEGLDGLKDNVSLINLLYRFGVRHAMLTWNRENEFATGVKSPNKNRGLTKLGIEVIKKMESLGMIVDVSHANEKTFWDIYERTTKPFIASHSNSYSICNCLRNLKDDQIKAIAQRNGAIGINAWPDFIDEYNPSVEKLADHIDYIADLVGIDCISFGFDFCDFLDSKTMHSMGDEDYVKTPGIEDASQIYNLLNILSQRGYKDEHLVKITYKNMERIVKEILL